MKGLGWFAGLVAIDFVTKQLATMFLPSDQVVEKEALFQFVYQRNQLGQLGLGTWAQGLKAQENYQQMAWSAFGYSALALTIIFVRRRKSSLSRKIALCVASFVLGYVFGGVVQHALGAFTPSTCVFLSRAGGTALFLVMWWAARPGPWHWATLLFSAAAVGNLLSLVLPYYPLT